MREAHKIGYTLSLFLSLSLSLSATNDVFRLHFCTRMCVRAMKTNTPIKSASLPPHSFIQSMGVEKKGFVKRRLQG